MKRIVQLVDSVEYVRHNCFQHQLELALSMKCELVQAELKDILYGAPVLADGFISCLKQRTLFQHAPVVGKWLHGAPLVVYDQDPWQAFMDDSPYKGAYTSIMEHINVKSFAVTTEMWVDFLRRRGLPATFVRMWVLSGYCDSGLSYEDRPIDLGFIGTVHPYRKALFDKLDELDLPVNVQAGNTLQYRDYLKALQKIRVFVHSEDGPLIVDGGSMNLKDGLWIKDIEAASQGCFSIRNGGAGYISYMQSLPTDAAGNRLVMQYKRAEAIPKYIEAIQKMDPDARQDLINRTVEHIRGSNKWLETAEALVAEAIG